MKVKIGPYASDLIPIKRWAKNYEIWSAGDKYFLLEEDYQWYDKIIFGIFNKLDDLVRPINRWANSRKRKIKIQVDGYDVWGLDHTLGIIITPLLKKLKEVKHGVPHVDDEDVPEHLRFMDGDKVLPYDVIDRRHQTRWEWILDEMIWTFEQYSMDDDTDQFHHNLDQLEMLFTPLEDGTPASTLNFNYQKDPTKPKYWVDEEGKKKHHERKQNGLRLFAKYYECLWD